MYRGAAKQCLGGSVLFGFVTVIEGISFWPLKDTCTPVTLQRLNGASHFGNLGLRNLNAKRDREAARLARGQLAHAALGTFPPAVVWDFGAGLEASNVAIGFGDGVFPLCEIGQLFQ